MYLGNVLHMHLFDAFHCLLSMDGDHHDKDHDDDDNHDDNDEDNDDDDDDDDDDDEYVNVWQGK